MIPNSCTSILWLDNYYEKNFIDSKTKTKVTIDVDMFDTNLTLTGQWTTIQLYQGTNTSDPDYFTIPLDIFITTND